HDNYGPGLWCDINSRNILYEGNTVIGNYHAGIFYEISQGGSIIRNNVSNNNGGTVGGYQIFVSSSGGTGTDVYGNNVRTSGNGGGIVMQADNRPDRVTLQNNRIHNNVITFTTNQNGRQGLANFSGTVGAGNWSNTNTFYVSNSVSDPHFFWNTSFPTTFASYRAASGQDANSTIQVGNGSVSGNTQGCPALTGCAGTTSPPPPTTNLALNKLVTVSSTEGPAYRGSYAVDGNAATRWSSVYSDPQWITIDLGSLKQINRVVLKWEVAYGKSYKIQLSSDNVNWTDIYSTTAGTGGLNDLTVSGTGRYLRMYGTVRGTAWGYSLWEMEAY
ncbi:MAG: discoidin domain-containing protein, partial [Pyrinomonadaceae bacterium]